MSGGRPSKLTRELLAKLEKIADDTWSIKEACSKIGIDESTWRRWEASGSDHAQVVQFCGLAARVRAGAGAKIDDAAWGALRQVIEDPEAKASDRIAAASAALRLRTAHRVEITGKDGGPLSVSVEDARTRLLAGLEQSGDRTDG